MSESIHLMFCKECNKKSLVRVQSDSIFGAMCAEHIVQYEDLGVCEKDTTTGRYKLVNTPQENQE